MIQTPRAICVMLSVANAIRSPGVLISNLARRFTPFSSQASPADSPHRLTVRMVNFRDPAEMRNIGFQVNKFWNVIDGLFIWEFLITLGYEWSVIRGHRPYRWTIWIYSVSRVATLAAVALNLVTISTTTPINCQAIIVPQFTFAYLALASASFLIVLRMYVFHNDSLPLSSQILIDAPSIAIWNMSRVVGAVAIGVWITNIAFLIQGVIRFRAEWVSDEVGCEVVQIEGIQLSTIAALVTDVVLLLIMLFGVFRLRRDGGGTMALGRLLWNQGIIWLFLATVAEVTPVVLIYLNLNDPFNLMFQSPWIITMTIVATRMYRSLSDFGSSDISHNILPISDRTMSGTKVTPTAPMPLNGIRVAVHMDHEQYPVPQTSYYNSYINMDKETHGTPRGLAIGPDLAMEIDVEK
ncbi:hypothetical protein BJV74DRAFT_953545 [Russula compacta]|nr:hypothetical protein BJV74DRAFT_953545 [Russula compacta]